MIKTSPSPNHCAAYPKCLIELRFNGFHVEVKLEGDSSDNSRIKGIKFTPVYSDIWLRFID